MTNASINKTFLNTTKFHTKDKTLKMACHRATQLNNGGSRLGNRVKDLGGRPPGYMVEGI